MGDADGPPVPPMEKVDAGGLSKLTPALQLLGKTLEAGFNAARSSSDGKTFEEAMPEAAGMDEEPGVEVVTDHESGNDTPSEQEDQIGTEIGVLGSKEAPRAGSVVVEKPVAPKDTDGAKDVAAAIRPRGPPLHKFRVLDSSRRPLGDLVWNTSADSLDAHCLCGHDVCHLNRSLKASAAAGRPAQGRPLGLLVAWLFAGPGSARDDHQASKRGKGPLAGHVSFTNRKSCREWLESNPAWHDFVARAGFSERLTRPDEDNEPVALP